MSLNLPNQVPFSRKPYAQLSNCPQNVPYPNIPQYIPTQNEMINNRWHGQILPANTMMPVKRVENYHELHNDQQYKSI
jgi:hypothetical protein